MTRADVVCALYTMGSICFLLGTLANRYMR